MSEWFPMSTARLVRDRRYVELRLDEPRWVDCEQNDADFDLCVHKDADGTRYMVGFWWADDERCWWLCVNGDYEEHKGFNAIDDDFTGWRNLAPVYPEGYSPSTATPDQSS